MVQNRPTNRKSHENRNFFTIRIAESVFFRIFAGYV